MTTSRHAQLLLRLLPPVAYDPNGLHVGLRAQAAGTVLDDLDDNYRALVSALSPVSANDLLSLWERNLAIEPEYGAPYASRVARILSRLRETGGLSLPYFTRIAAGLGYQIDIEEQGARVLGQTWCGMRLRHPDTLWVWTVHVGGPPVRIWHARCGSSRCGERLTMVSDPIIETLFNDLKPADTRCLFYYEG
ncbi:YmfQ family protein [Pseudogulbenkiania ferrooxidans]|uniref:Phage tail protein n=1 Tax=Pseudogulbenkiania ferrooxidans 2002 TaxID=279714 RepID=B9Z2Z2_9NEIS|nr:putative phage tail protein [Pseudogulbenkiania ferrooxidans]EEG08945.1 conserved hypothetical protein [Pseudogulbenkiania ferrooxidans 2002]